MRIHRIPIYLGPVFASTDQRPDSTYATSSIRESRLKKLPRIPTYIHVDGRSGSDLGSRRWRSELRDVEWMTAWLDERTWREEDAYSDAMSIGLGMHHEYSQQAAKKE